MPQNDESLSMQRSPACSLTIISLRNFSWLILKPYPFYSYHKNVKSMKISPKKYALVM